ncbi:MAG TPA: cytochrome c oxidase assembly protein [Bryobacteraceae bacterium]|nr:cytochrome c oxidase assembly protein [Bryobacteraceae bacterium]
MDPVSNAALSSWAINPLTSAVLALTAVLYLRGWLRGRELIRTPRDGPRLASFLGGLFLIFLATESPLDTFDSLFLSAHMTQHLILMMLAPPLILFGYPTLPLLRGLPKRFVKEGLGPFLTWPLLKAVTGVLVSPLFAWLAFAFSTIFWHLPFFYELALRSAAWHGVEHASFFWTGILFWWPVIQPTPAKAKWPLWSKIPYLLFADIVNTALSAFFVFSGRLLYPSYGVVRASSFSALDDQIVAGLIMWVPGSLVYLLPAFAFAVQLLSGNRPGSTLQTVRVQRRPRPAPRASHWKKTPALRRAAQYLMLLLAATVMADGCFGQQVAPLNLAGMLPWIHWRALSVLALLAVGNLFCMVCPFTLVRDFGRKVLPAKAPWPRFLRNKWLPIALFVLYLWLYEAFNLWESPFLTASIIFGYFLAAFFTDGKYSGASFCKYVCPIGQFHFVSSFISPREVRVRNAATCQSCRTFDCIKGNEKARGCELDLFQPKKSSNLDCTFCLDCIKACPHDNVGVLPVIPMKTMLADPYRSSLGRLSKRTDWAALVLVFVFGALANAAGMTEPVMMWEHSWHARLGPDGMPLIVGVFTLAFVVLIPVLLIALCWLLNLLVIGEKRRTSDQARRLVFTLAPLGFSMWAAHLLYHFATAWAIVWPVTGAQLLLLDAGLLTTLYTGWKIARQVSGKLRSAIELTAPWAAVAIAGYCAFVWVLFQPMQMRGMMQ